MSKGHVLIIDDDDLIHQSMSIALRNFTLEFATTAEEGIQLIRNAPFKYCICFIDHNLSPNSKTLDNSGSYAAAAIKRTNPLIYVVMASGEMNKDAIEAWLDAKADKFIFKPLEPTVVSVLAEAAAADFAVLISVEDEGSREIDREGSEALRITKMVGRSIESRNLARQTLKCANSDLPVLITGETGTGKEITANALHANSERRKRPMLAVNCANFKGNEQMLEVELFGSEKGAFTGAENREGIISAARGGTVFLDEIHHLSPTAQAKLLRAIEQSAIRKVGGREEMRVDFRLITAGAADLRERCASGEFSLDLYFRIAALDLKIAPLRNRTEDIMPLFMHFKQIAEHRSGVEPKQFLKATTEALLKYSWPGNVRELRQLIDRIYVMVDSSIVRPSDLPKEITDENQEARLALNGKFLTLTQLKERHATEEKQLILAVMAEAHQNTQKAADTLGVARSTLASILKAKGLFEISGQERSLLSMISLKF